MKNKANNTNPSKRSQVKYMIEKKKNILKICEIEGRMGCGKEERREVRDEVRGLYECMYGVLYYVLMVFLVDGWCERNVRV